MKRVFRYSSLAFLALAGIELSYASMHPASFGSYSTAVAEDRLFIEDGTKLRCDLFFSSAKNSDKIVAPKGSLVAQTVPPFVWQYSGLLPVSDYLKTVVMHSASSDEKARSWQDVQQTFYNGLRAEGAREHEAKLAYAGAYAFAPRWPLVELVDITKPARDKETRLYRVEYIAATSKGVSIEEYRTLVEYIIENSDTVSLSDIRGVIDAADAVKAKGTGGNWLKKFWRNESKKPGAKSAKSMSAKDALDSTAASSDDYSPAALFVSDGDSQSGKEMEIAQDHNTNIANDLPVAMVEDVEDEVLSSAQQNQGNNLGSLFQSEKDLMASATEQGEKAEPVALQTVEIAIDESATEEPAEAQTAQMGVVVPLDNISVAKLPDPATEVIQDSASISEQLAEADQEVILDGTVEKAPLKLAGEVVDLDTILIDDQVPQEVLIEEVVPTAETRASQDWTLMPDGSQVLEVIPE